MKNHYPATNIGRKEATVGSGWLNWPPHPAAYPDQKMVVSILELHLTPTSSRFPINYVFFKNIQRLVISLSLYF